MIETEYFNGILMFLRFVSWPSSLFIN
jgi:hypothetical protein